MIDARTLDDALQAGAFRLGALNTRPVRCALCSIDCLPGQARRMHLGVRWGRSVYLCHAHTPKAPPRAA
jgi:hypothetical protein